MANQVDDALSSLRTPYFNKTLPFIGASTKTHVVNDANKNHTVTVTAKLDTRTLQSERLAYEISLPLGDLNWIFLVYPFGIIGGEGDFASVYLRLQFLKPSSDLSPVPAEFSFDGNISYTRSFEENDFWGIQKWKDVKSHPDMSIVFFVKVNSTFMLRKDKTPVGKCWPAIEWKSVSEMVFSKPGDITIHGSDWKYIVHKDIICERSSYFKAMFSHDTKESKNNEIVIPDEESDIMKAVLEYIYWGRINNLPELADRLFISANKYCLSELETLCVDYLCSIISDDNVIDLLNLADSHSCEILKSHCFDYLKMHLKPVIDSEGWLALNKSPKLAFQIADFLGKLLITD